MNAVQPDLDTVTPAEEIIDLSAEQRQQRVKALIEQANDILHLALETHLGGKTLTGKVVLFSGGNDSTVLIHLMRRLEMADYAGHANTTIGIEATRQFVRDTCAAWNLPLLEKYPPKTFRELVIAAGFPGPGHHYKMYQQLKERGLRQIRRDFVKHQQQQRVLFISGRRRAESRRRRNKTFGKNTVPLHERAGSVIWAAPLAMWTSHDMVVYRAMMDQEGDPVPFNPVTDALGMSGECLCGSFAQEGELERIRLWFPDTAAEIDALAVEVAAAGWQEPHCTWGHRDQGRSTRTGRLCGSCEFSEESDPQ